MKAVLASVVIAACSAPHGPVTTTEKSVADKTAPTIAALADPALVLLATPRDGHQAFIQAIDHATASIDMTMFHLTDPDIVEAFARAAGRGVHIRVILDGTGLETKKFAKVADQLREHGIEVRGSSRGFSITHVKAMVVDHQSAFITAINLTRDVSTTRDFGVVTGVRGVVDDVEALFAADWDNAATNATATPPQHEPSLVVSPVSSRERLVALIGSATRELVVTVENLGDRTIEDALAAAAHRGVTVRLIVPMCDKNPNPALDFAPAVKLAARGVQVRMMPAPESATHPYMHSKMILADGATAYVGSVNFSTNSTTKARELGIVFVHATATAEIHAVFETDWAQAVTPPATPPTDCTASD